MKLKIELFKEQYADELSRMIYKTINEMEKQNPDLDYSLIREEDTPQELIKASKKGIMWIAKTDNKIIGTISLTGSRLRRFFVHPQYQRKGIGRKLVDKLSDYAKDHSLKEIYAGAILSAVPTYKKLGFEEGEMFHNPKINQKEMKMRLILYGAYCD